ncbi:MAG: hypothetical protein ACJ79S_13135, partial [Gemmatimonadaceae bacterium]
MRLAGSGVGTGGAEHDASDGGGAPPTSESMSLPDATPHRSVAPGTGSRRPLLLPRPATIFVWSVWAALLLVVLVCIARYGHDVPLAEDWLMVAPLTGHEPSVARWLWAQNNEHRVPLPKLVYLGVLELAGGDFRAGMVVNTLIAALVAAAMMRTARRLRGGRTSYADAFFPATMLHLGHWENLVWGWQLQFVLSAALTCTLLLVVVRAAPTAPGARDSLVAAAALVLLPLSGANGLIFAVAMAPWAAYAGAREARGGVTPGARRAGRALVGAVGVALVLVGVYFIDWYSPPWNPPNPGKRESLLTAVKFAAMAFGPVASHWWTLAAVGAAAALGPAALLVLRAAGRAR